MDTTLADPLLGVVLDGRYRVDAVLAYGGMSTVYTGSDLRLDRPVAIKVMSPSFSSDPAFVRQFGTEARSAARLSHPHVVSVHDQGTDGEHVFLVMELVRGRTLRHLLQERGAALSPELAVSLLEPVLAALGAAHRAGLVHRDVKPENVLLSDDGVVKVADFGLARAVASATSTQSGNVMGTVAYVAPEQVSQGATDARTDVYSAGIMFYEMLVGAPPYRGDSAISVAYRHVHEDVPAPSAANSGVPAELDALVLAATRRDPSARPADADAFGARLRAARVALGLRHVPVPARPPADLDGSIPAIRATQAEQAATQAVHGLEPGDPSGPGPNQTRALRVPFTPPLPRVRPLPAAGPDEPPPPRLGATGYPGHGLPDHTGYPDHHAERRVRRWRGMVVLAAILLLGAGAAGAGWSYGVLRYTTVPALRGMTPDAATRAAHDSHLRVRPTTSAVFDDTVKPGLVTGSDPAPGKRATRGAELTLLISRGPGPRAIPDLTGRDAQDAVRALSDLRLTSRVEQVFGDVGAGTVAGTSPGPGSKVGIGSTVTVLVSQGRLPNTVGDARDDAVRRLRGAGLKVRVTEELTDETARGKVASQQPSGGIVRPGATVTLVVSKGTKSVRVPNVIGKNLADARAELEQLGFKVKVNLVLGGRTGRVVAQTPLGGLSQHRGATIRLGVV